MGLVSDKSLLHRESVWQCPNQGSHKVRIMQAHACRHSLQKEWDSPQKSVNAVHCPFQAPPETPLSTICWLWISCSLRAFLDVLHTVFFITKFALFFGLWGGSSHEFGHVLAHCCSELWFQQRLLEWPAHRKLLPCQFTGCIRAAVRSFPQVVVTAHLSVWI